MRVERKRMCPAGPVRRRAVNRDAAAGHARFRAHSAAHAVKADRLDRHTPDDDAVAVRPVSALSPARKNQLPALAEYLHAAVFLRNERVARKTAERKNRSGAVRDVIHREELRKPVFRQIFRCSVSIYAGKAHFSLSGNVHHKAHLRLAVNGEKALDADFFDFRLAFVQSGLLARKRNLLCAVQLALRQVKVREHRKQPQRVFLRRKQPFTAVLGPEADAVPAFRLMQPTAVSVLCRPK